MPPDQYAVDSSYFVEGMDIVLINMAKLVEWRLFKRVCTVIIILIIFTYLPYYIVNSYKAQAIFIFHFYISNLYLCTVTTT